MNVKTGRPIDIRTVGSGWHNVYDGFTKKSELATALKDKWDSETSKAKGRAGSKI